MIRCCFCVGALSERRTRRFAPLRSNGTRRLSRRSIPGVGGSLVSAQFLYVAPLPGGRGRCRVKCRGVQKRGAKQPKARIPCGLGGNKRRGAIKNARRGRLGGAIFRVGAVFQIDQSRGMCFSRQTARVFSSHKLACTSPMCAQPIISMHRRDWPMPPPIVRGSSPSSSILWKGKARR